MSDNVVKSLEIRHKDDVFVCRFTGDLFEFSHTDTPANADDHHLGLDHAFQQLSLPLYTDIIINQSINQNHLH